MTKIIYYFSVVLALFTAVGAGSCAKENDGPMNEELPANTIHAVYKLTGTVVDQLTELPVAGVEVEMNSDSRIIKNEQSRLKAVTDSRGKFELQALVASAENGVDFQITINDKSGTYANKDILVGFDNPEFANGDGNLYLGETIREMRAIELSVKGAEDPTLPDQGEHDDTNAEGVE